MSNDADLTAREWLSRTPSDDERDAELVRLRERLAFYQSFDGLIQDNITRSSDLLRQAMQMRESSAAEIAAARAETERQRADDRDHYRVLFSGLLDEVTTLQVQAERLARRLSTALDNIELDSHANAFAALPTDLDLNAASSFLGELSFESAESTESDESPSELLLEDEESISTNDDLAELIDPIEEDETLPILDPTPDNDLTLDALHEPEERDELVSISSSQSIPEASLPPLDESPDEAVETSDDVPDQEIIDTPPPSNDASVEAEPEPVESDLLDDIPLDILPFSPEDIVQSRTLRSESGPIPEQTPIAEPPDAAQPKPTLPASTTSATIVLVHGVPRATMALSLKRYLEGLAHVGSVEPREFAEGILRLEVSGDRPLAFDDLRLWPEAIGLEPVHLRDDLVEVRLAL